MICSICKKPKDEAELYEGIYDNNIVTICTICAEKENIPLIKKPTQEQLDAAEHRLSVRERMEQLSGKVKHLGKDQEVANKNLAKLRIPPQKQDNEDLVDHYHWILKQARRMRKISINQVSQNTGVPAELIESIEKGQPPANFKPVVAVLENFFKITLLKYHKPHLKYIMPEATKEEIENEILQQTRERMQKMENENNFGIEEEALNEKKEKQEIADKIKKGQIDFSKKEQIENITLNDLIEIKRQKERKELEMKKQKEIQEKELKKAKQIHEMFGNELELEEE